MSLRVTQLDGRVRFSVRVQPRAARSEFVGLHGDAIKLRLSAVPVGGAANDELVRMLAGAFAVGARAVKIIAGPRSRSKVVEIEGITERMVREVLAGIVR
jgi:uncharacterized protein (TIGR00251 family)